MILSLCLICNPQKIKALLSLYDQEYLEAPFLPCRFSKGYNFVISCFFYRQRNAKMHIILKRIL